MLCNVSELTATARQAWFNLGMILHSQPTKTDEYKTCQIKQTHTKHMQQTIKNIQHNTTPYNWDKNIQLIIMEHTDKDSRY